MCAKDAYKMVNSVNPDEAALVYTLYPELSLQTHWIIASGTDKEGIILFISP